MENKALLKQQKIEEKNKLKAMTKEEKKAYLDNKKAFNYRRLFFVCNYSLEEN